MNHTCLRLHRAFVCVRKTHSDEHALLTQYLFTLGEFRSFVMTGRNMNSRGDASVDLQAMRSNWPESWGSTNNAMKQFEIARLGTDCQDFV